MKYAEAVRALSSAVSLTLLGAVVSGCLPSTDHVTYESGEAGVVTLDNRLDFDLFVGGCQAFGYQKRVGEEWVDQPPDFVCIWEGFAVRVPAGGQLELPFEARDPGKWRLVFPLGAGCDEGAPMNEQHCRIVFTSASNAFDVVPDLTGPCVATGCSSQLCSDRHIATTCEYRSEYACYRAARCGLFGDPAVASGCAWEPTGELLACLDRATP